MRLFYPARVAWFSAPKMALSPLSTDCQPQRVVVNAIAVSQLRQAKTDSRSLIASSNWASVSFLFLHGLLAREKRGAGHRLARRVDFLFKVPSSQIWEPPQKRWDA